MLPEAERNLVLAAVPRGTWVEFYSSDDIISITHRSHRREFVSTIEAIEWAEVLHQVEARR